MTKGSKDNLVAKLQAASLAVQKLHEAQQEADTAVQAAFSALCGSESSEAYQAFLDYMFFKFETPDRIIEAGYEAEMELGKFVDKLIDGADFKKPETKLV